MRVVKPFFKIVVAGICCCILFAAFTQSSLPESWSENMKMTLKHYGGRSGQSTEIEISTNGFESITKQGKETRKTISFSSEELDDLLDVLKKYDFERIQTVKRKSIAHDKPTTELKLVWNTMNWSVSSGASNEIRESDKANYQEIVNYLSTFLQKKQIQWP